MAANLSAILNIAAKVTGEGAINGISGAMGKLNSASNTATGTLKRLAGGAGGLGGALGMLAPALSVGGLVTMATNSIKGAAAMYDLSQKTGVSVEALARFKKAASVSGTDIESVSKAIMKLSKGMNEAAQSGKGPVAEAFKTLGLSVTDATGKLKTGDQMMIEIADKFKAMPNGVEKTALALQLFGRSGAEMIPMLNMGGDAIDKLKVKMTAAFAEKANEYSDKLTILSGKIGGIGTSIAIALLPALDVLASALTTIVDWFTKLPEPIQAIVGGFTLLAIGATALAPLILVLGPAFTAIGAAITAITAGGLAATIAGWLGALAPLLGALGTLGQILIGIFSGPVGWAALLIAAAVALYAFRDKIGEFLSWIGGAFAPVFNAVVGVAAAAWQAISAAFVKYVITPITGAWSSLMTVLGNALNAYVNFYKGVITTLFALFVYYVVTPITSAWSSLMTVLGNALSAYVNFYKGVLTTLFALFVYYVVTPIANAWSSLMTALGNALNTLGSFFSRVWQAIGAAFGQYVATPIASIWSSLMTNLSNALNTLGSFFSRVWQAISAAFSQYVVTPITAAWSALSSALGRAFTALATLATGAWQAISTAFGRFVVAPISTAWTNLTTFLTGVMTNVTTGISNLWNGMVGNVKGALRSMLSFAANALNSVIGAIRTVIQGINVARAAVNMGPIGMPGFIKVPAFAEGGVVNRPTLAMVGEGGQSEYIIPASKMAAASSAYLSGARGSSVLQGGGSAGGAAPRITINTGPVMQTPDGQQWVTLSDLEAAQRQTVLAVMGQLRSPAGRYAVGVR